MHLEQKKFYVCLAFFLGTALLPATWPNLSLGRAGDFPYWLFGAWLPSEPHLHKAWIVPLTVLIATLILRLKGREQLPLKFHWADALLVAWCLWPLMRLAFTPSSIESAAFESLHITGVWAAAWVVGRITGSSSQAIRALIIAALVILPLAVLEGLKGPFFHELIYASHPFALDGAIRYVGFRPLLFFENGNQYGIFVCLAALAALATAYSPDRRPSQIASQKPKIAAPILFLAALASQSLGAVLLMIIGFIAIKVRFLTKRLLIAGLITVLSLSAVYLSAKAPIESLARNTSVGQKTLDVFRTLGRGSLPWRISQDQRALAKVENPLIGQGRWDWFKEANTRPWGLYQLIFGQFGLIGLTLFCGAFLVPPILAYMQALQTHGPPQYGTRVLASITLLAVLDAALNSFVFPGWALFAGVLTTQLNQQDELKT